MKECWVVDLDEIGYEEALELQNSLIKLRQENKIPDVLLLLEHPHTITEGAGSTDKMLRKPREEILAMGVKIVKTDRGGKTTYHGPGQIVGYVIRQLDKNIGSINAHKTGLEDTMIRTSKHYGVNAVKLFEDDPETKRRIVGAWYKKGEEDHKIGAVGVVSKEGVTKHGFAININTDLSYFDLIDPCGFKDKYAISLEKILGKTIDLEKVKQTISNEFANIFGYELETKTYEELKELLKVQ